MMTHNDNQYNINSNKRIIKNSTKKNQSTNKKEILQKTRQIMEYNAQEYNQLSYEKALKLDKRTFCEYYISLVKTKHDLIFSFYYNNDYNSRIIKIDLFFISFTIYYTVNALFFNDDTMHKIYEDKGKYHIIYQLPQIIYSTLTSAVLNILLKLLGLSESDILELKEKKKIIGLNKRNKELNSKLQIKFLLFFIVSFIFLLFFWYYISMFCAIYSNTQTHLIKDTLLSFTLSMIYPFGIYLLPALFRIPALSNENNKRNCLYKLSKILQMI